MSQSSFTRSDGTEIKLLDGYFERIIDNKTWPWSIENFKDFVSTVFEDPYYPKKKLTFFFNKLITTDYFLEFLNRHQRKPSFHRHLDIGAGPGVRTRMLKSLGIVNEAIANDILDRENDYPDDWCLKVIKNLEQAYNGNEPNLEDIDRSDLIEIYTQVRKITAKKYMIDQKPSKLLDPAVNLQENRWSLDGYRDGNIIELDFPDSNFDLITAFLCIDHLPVPKLFRKINRLLEPGGIFFFNATNWYQYTGGAMHLPMDAPWLHARLSKEDLIRYYKEVRPEYAEAAEKAIYMPTPHMTTFDFIERAEEIGWNTIAWERFTDEELLNSFFINNYSYVVNQVLDQSKDINSSVELRTLLTKNRAIAFQKPR